MLIASSIARPFLTAVMMMAAGMALGQDYPNHPIRIITASPGGAVDLVARLIATKLSASWGQQVIVENRGGSGVIAGDALAKAPADGYTLLFYGAGIWLVPFMRDTSPFDPVRDFAPITLATSSPGAIAVHPSLPVKSVKDLIALAKAKPGQINNASICTGTSSHLAAELFKFMTGTNIVNVAYRGNAEALSAIISGEVQLMFTTVTAILPYSKVGRMRLLAVTSAEPTALAPGVPTVAASGVPGFESSSTLVFFAPAKTPSSILSRLNQETVRILNQVDVKDQLLRAGIQVVASTPEQLAATMKADMGQMGKVIRDAKIRDQ